MTEVDVTNDGVVTPESVTSDHVVTPKRDRAAYMRDYRARIKAADNLPQAILDQINPESKLNGEIPQQELTEAAPGSPARLVADKYEQEEIPKADEAAERLRQQLKALHQAQELHHRQQQQADEINRQIAQEFNFWRQNGLTPDQEQLLRANPALMVELSGFAANEAAKQHQVGSSEFVDAGKKLFFQHLAHLQEQMRANQRTVATTDNQHIAEPVMQPNNPFLEPMPSPAPSGPQPSTRSTIVSAPVSRELPGNYRSDFENNPRNVRLTADQVEAARIAGVDLQTYAANLMRMQRMKATGEIV